MQMPPLLADIVDLPADLGAAGRSFRNGGLCRLVSG
jgi:hypothetical protein